LDPQITQISQINGRAHEDVLVQQRRSKTGAPNRTSDGTIKRVRALLVLS